MNTDKRAEKNTQISFILLIAAMLVFTKTSFGNYSDFIKTVNYKPLPGYSAFQLNHDPGDDPFALDGPGFQYLGNDQCSSIIFQIGLVRAYVGEGKIIHFLSAKPDDLKSELAKKLGENFTNAGPAVTGKIGGLIAVSMTATKASGMSYLFSWVQLETNIVLKITAVSCDEGKFKAVTNSLQSLKLDKKQVLDSLEPTKPDIKTSRLNRIEYGFIQVQKKPVATFVFYADDRILACSSFGDGNYERTLNQPLGSFAKLRDLSNQPNGLRMAVVDIGMDQSSPGEGQKSCSFIAETNPAAISQLKAGDYRLPMEIYIWKIWDKVPDDFQKLGNYEVNATLFVRKEEY
jgi:hypothetical protein